MDKDFYKEVYIQQVLNNCMAEVNELSEKLKFFPGDVEIIKKLEYAKGKVEGFSRAIKLINELNKEFSQKTR